MGTKDPSWPITRSNLLDEFKRALRRRSKGIKHSVFAWSIERSTEQFDGLEYESLLSHWELTTGEMWLHLREDGLLWLGAREWSDGVYKFEFSFYAELGSASCDDLVRVLKASITPISIRESSDDAKDRVLALWERFGPFDVDRGRV